MIYDNRFIGSIQDFSPTPGENSCQKTLLSVKRDRKEDMKYRGRNLDKNHKKKEYEKKCIVIKC